MNKKTENEIDEYISNGELDKAIELLIKLSKSIENTKTSNSVLIQKSKYKRLQLDLLNGVISHQEKELNLNRITSAILKLNKEIHEKNRNSREKAGNMAVNSLSREEIFAITKSAIIIIELEKIKYEYGIAEFNIKNSILQKIFPFSLHSTKEVSLEVYSFISDIAALTRHGMDSEISSTILSLLMEFFPHELKGKRLEDFLEIVVIIGDSILYDSMFYLKNYQVSINALSILKWVYWIGKNNDFKVLIERVINVYNEIAIEFLNKDEAYILEKMIIKVFKEDLEKKGLVYPKMPGEILSILKQKENTPNI